MAEQLQRLPRPTAALEIQEATQILPSRGVNRSHLTLYLSIGAILLSLAGAGVQLFIFLAGHQQQMAAQVALDNANRELVAVQIGKEKELARAAKFEADLKLAQTQEAVAAKINHDQDTAKKNVETLEARQRTRKAKVDADVAEDLTEVFIPQFQRVIGNGLDGGNMPGLMPMKTHSTAPIGRGSLPGGLPPMPTPTFKVDN